MTMRFLAHMGAGNARFHCSDARRFSHYVDNVRFWFAVHTPVNCQTGLVVSHWDSGMRVCDITPSSMGASVGADWPTMARRRLDAFCEEKGKARVYAVLRRAESQGYGVQS